MMIDWGRVQDLRDEIGADAFAEVVELFLDEVDTEIGKLRLPNAGQNLTAFADLCHSGERAAAMGAGASVDLTAVLDCYAHSKSEFVAGLDRVIAA
jgi:hypothetical protein